MSLALEYRKMKRTGFFPAFLGGGILAAIVPAAELFFRRDSYTTGAESPLSMVLGSNWQMMAMLNILLIVSGACIMYHTEYADRGYDKMRALPIKESAIFFEKVIVMTGMCCLIFIIEAAAATLCISHWFAFYPGFSEELLKSFGYFFLLSLPVILTSLLIASACRNMWISLGIGVICVFTATLLPAKSFVLSLFPFALPFHTLAGTPHQEIPGFMAASVLETTILGIAELIYLKIRRSLL